PSIKYFEHVAKAVPDFDPDKAIVIGDSLTSDMRGGINAGIDTCWYNPKGKAAPNEMNLTYIVNDFSEIVEILSK
ncbi:MAG: HAD family hydrolase, partial [Ruminococcaceae bacterium]|nr:HAD family hydrolase [Oscillospiraceae bacterium]